MPTLAVDALACALVNIGCEDGTESAALPVVELVNLGCEDGTESAALPTVALVLKVRRGFGLANDNDGSLPVSLNIADILGNSDEAVIWFWFVMAVAFCMAETGCTAVDVRWNPSFFCGLGAVSSSPATDAWRT